MFSHVLTHVTFPVLEVRARAEVPCHVIGPSTILKALSYSAVYSSIRCLKIGRKHPYFFDVCGFFLFVLITIQLTNTSGDENNDVAFRAFSDISPFREGKLKFLKKLLKAAMKMLITPYIGKQTISFAFKEGFDRGDKLTVLIPKEKLEKGLGLENKELSNLLDEIENLELGLDLEKKILKTSQFEELVQDISKVFMSAEENVSVNISSDDPAVTSALTLCCSFYGGSIERVYIQDQECTGFKEISFPHSKIDLNKNEKEFLKTVVREGPKTLNEIIEETRLSKSTVSRLSRILEDKGLVKAHLTGKEKEVDSTLAGEIKVMVLHNEEKSMIP